MTWDTAQQEKFKAELNNPFFDLLEGIGAVPAGAKIVDLGCGTGELTRELHLRTRAADTLGIDSSHDMLSRTLDLQKDGLHFRFDRIEDFSMRGAFDLIFSNAALQGCAGHEALFVKLRDGLRPGGRLAIQMPAYPETPSHRIADEIAGELPFRDSFDAGPRTSQVLEPEAYAALLHRLGFLDARVTVRVYAHLLPSREDAVALTQRTLLASYAERLGRDLYVDFLEEYRRRLFAVMPDERPLFYPFKRLLLWARIRD